MEKTPNIGSLASLVALAILILFPVRSWCKEDIYKSLTVVKPQCCVGEAAELKRFGDVDYNSFVSLMGRRSAVQPNSDFTVLSYAGRVDLIFADLLGRRTQ
uniref:Neuromedin-K n=1 Tax=Anabas testudineus TaxID=64144 RepID=A0A3Q1H4S0_ANATE